MKFEKIKIEQNKTEDITSSDIKMFRVTVQFPMHKSADISCLAEEASSRLSYCDDEDFKDQPIMLEQANITNTDLVEFNKKHPGWVIYNFNNDSEALLDDILNGEKKNSANKKKTKR